MSFSKSLIEKRDAALAKAEAIVEAAQAEAEAAEAEAEAAEAEAKAAREAEEAAKAAGKVFKPLPNVCAPRKFCGLPHKGPKESIVTPNGKNSRHLGHTTVSKTYFLLHFFLGAEMT